ncbi:MAG: M23 family metallopeptidase [Parvularculales bacterium]
MNSPETNWQEATISHLTAAKREISRFLGRSAIIIAGGVAIALMVVALSAYLTPHTKSQKTALEGLNPQTAIIAILEGTEPESVEREATEPLIDNNPQSEPQTVSLTFAKGDNLAGLLMDHASLSPEDIHHAITALKPYTNPRRIQMGQKLVMNFAPSDAKIPDATNSDTTASNTGASSPVHEVSTIPDLVLASFSLETALDRNVTAIRLDDGKWQGHEEIIPLERRYRYVSGTIDSSLYVAAQKAGAHPKIINDMIQIYSHDIDFQREIRQGDRFTIVYESEHTPEGRLVRHNKIQYTSLTIKGEPISFWRHTPSDTKIASYYDASGHSAQRFLMRTPVDGARLSSRFGMRRHPILGYSRMHQGVDFAAPRGTPIYAAGNGTVEFVGRKGAYGKYIRIRHANGYKTVYAHLHRYGRGIRKGVRVSQGQVIGTVGSTGLSTGPHLHYEVHHMGKAINPASTRKMPRGRQLTGALLSEFRNSREIINRRVSNLLEGQSTQADAGSSSALDPMLALSIPISPQARQPHDL